MQRLLGGSMPEHFLNNKEASVAGQTEKQEVW